MKRPQSLEGTSGPKPPATTTTTTHRERSKSVTNRTAPVRSSPHLAPSRYRALLFLTQVGGVEEGEEGNTHLLDNRHGTVLNAVVT